MVGSFLLDRFEEKNRIFTSKHKYLLEAVDSEVICALLSAIREQKKVVLTSYGYRRGKKQREVLPLKVALTTQSGRNYLMCYEFSAKRFLSCRIDSIENVRGSETPYASFRDKKQALEERLKKTWGVYVDSSEKPEWLKVYISVREGEDYIVQRLQKEKRTGSFGKGGGKSVLSELGNVRSRRNPTVAENFYRQDRKAGMFSKRVMFGDFLPI